MNLLKVQLLSLMLLLVASKIIKAQEDDEGDVEGTEAEEEGDGEDAEDVLVLTDSNFDENVAQYPDLLVEFYAPWCGHCKSLAPEYERAAKVLKDAGSEAKLAKVDATEQKDVGSRFDISGYPTLKFFKNGEAHEFEAGRTAEAIVDKVNEMSSPDWKPPPESVVTLTQDNFDSFIQENPLSLVEFYAPWCGHCKRLAPEYEKASQILSKQDPPIPLGKVDSTIETELASRFEVTGYPTLKMFRKGKVFEYNGGRDMNGIVEYMLKQVGEASKLVNTQKEIKSLSSKDDITIIGFFENEDTPMYQIFMELANKRREEFAILHTFDKKLMNVYKTSADHVVLFHPEHLVTETEPKSDVIKMVEPDDEELAAFIKEHRLPLVGHLTMSGMEGKYKEAKPLAVLFYDVNFTHEYITATQLWRNKFARIAKDFPSMTFAVADEEDMSRLVNAFGFGDSGESMFFGIIGTNDKFYPMDPIEDYEEDDIRDYIKKFDDDKLKPRVKSQLAPKKNKGPYYVVVGKTFEEVVNDPSKDVVLHVYRRGRECPECDKADKVLKKLAKKFADDEKSLVFAKIDAAQNDLPASYTNREQSGIFFAVATQKDTPLMYDMKADGALKAKSIEQYLRKHADVSFGNVPPTEGKREEL